MKTALLRGIFILLSSADMAMAADEPNSYCGCAAKSEIQPAGVSAGKLINSNHIMRGFEEGQERVKVIVNLAEPVEIKAKMDWHSRQSRQSLQNEIKTIQTLVLSDMDGNEFRMRYRFDNQAGFSGEVTLKGLEKLENDPRVISVEPVYILEPHLRQGIPLMHADTYRSSYNGTGVAIAICDTGIDYTHPMLGNGGFPNSKVIGGYDYGDYDSNPMPDSTQAHGTCCAGIAAGDLGDTSDYIGGVAYNAKLYALKITSGSSGSATSDAMIAAWNWCITHQNDNPAYPILAVSTSFGGSRYYSTCDGQAGTTAVNTAVAAGIAMLASSGNDGYCDSISWPACISNMISVGAVYDDGFGTYQPCVNAASCATKYSTSGCSTGYYANDSTAVDMVTSYSNTASFLTVLASSNKCYTSDIAGSGGYSSGDYYSAFGGTSAASPYAAGAVSCLQSAAMAINGSYLSPSEVRTILTSTGDNITDGKVAITKPRINLEQAIEYLFGPPTANNVTVATPLNTAMTITFQATDEGLPDPPGVMSYIIISLPSGGSLSDPGAGGITTVPYTLVSYGNQVVYTPAAGYAGIDNFMFKANDGGVPPSGGDSNQATVSVTVGWVTVECAVSASYDDVYESKNTQYLTAAYLQIGYRSILPYYMSGMRFANVSIPSLGQVVSAQLKICSYTSSLTNMVYGIIQGEDADNAAGFSGRYLSNIVKTTASANWDHSTAWSATTWYTSPDISPIIQEIIDRPGWSAGNALAIVYSTRTASGSYRQFSSYNRGADYAPRLEVTYLGPITLTTSSTVGGAITTPGQGAFYYKYGTVVSIAATPAANYHFVNWMGSGVAAGKVADPNSANTTVTMDADYTLQANFALPIIPDVTGQTQAAAEAAITTATFTVGTITTAYSDTVAAGDVISQSPVGGTAAASGTAVDMVVSLGLPIIPDVTGQAQATAEANITAATFTVGTVTTAYSDTVAVGNVISQSIVGPATSGTAVDLVVSDGPRDRIISGRVLEPDTVTPIEGVLVTADNGGNSDITDPNGYYELTVVYGWSGVVDPNATGYIFDPNSRTYTNVTSDMTDQNYTGSLDAFIISGHILKDDGVTPIEGVTVTPENGGGYFTDKYDGDGSDATDPNGYYELTVDYNWSGKVTPAHNAYTFDPNNRMYTNVISDITGQDYAGTMLTFSISGYIKNILGTPIDEVLVTAQNGGGTDITDATGYYEVGVSYGWTDSVIAAWTDYTFTPSEALYVNVTANTTGDFLAKLDADINGDGYVNVSDLLIMAANWLMPGDLNTGNLNGDSIIDMKDVSELAEYWLEGI